VTPKILSAADVAKVLGWETRRAKRWLRKSGAGRKVGGRYVATPASLLRHFPEAFEAMAGLTAEAEVEPECASCDELRAALLERNRENQDLRRRLVQMRPGTTR
jgi:hypothetical protein